jgi:hypothetical protein
MPPLFRLAVDRGGAADIVAENRAALVVLALYATGRGMGELVPAAKQWPQPAWRTVTLAGRDDFAKHFLLSAAIAAEGGSPLADAIGVYKEIADSRGGSGFSFNDMGANRAGTRFGEVASQSPGRARQLARAVASGVKESDFMPDVSDLPDRDLELGVLLALLQDDAKNQSSYLTWKEGVPQADVAAILRRDFLVSAERADKLSGAWGRHPLLGRMYLPAYRAGTELVARLRREHPPEVILPALYGARGLVDAQTLPKMLGE